MMSAMPSLVTPVMSPGSLNAAPQPTLPIDDDLLLRPWLSSDAGAVARVFQDRAIQFWHLRKADSEDETLEWIEQWRRGWENESACHWAVADAAWRPGSRTGLPSVHHPGRRPSGDLLLDEPGVPWLGRLLPSCGPSVELGTGRSGFNRLELGHSTMNAASCRIAEKTGFALEGVRRQALLHADGWHDMHLHARVHEA